MLTYSLLRIPWPLHTRLDALAAALGYEATNELECAGKIDALEWALGVAEERLRERGIEAAPGD